MRYLRWHLDGAPSGSARSLSDGSLKRTGTTTSGQASQLFQPFSGICSHNPTQYFFGILPENACSNDGRLNDRGAVTFTSAPVSTPRALTGPMNLRLWAKTTGKDANVVAIVSDVAPDGTTSQLSFGALFASNRAVESRACRAREALDCSLYGGPEVIRPFHPFTRAAQRPVPANTPMKLDIEIYPVSHVLRRGHRLRISLLTADFPAAPPTTALVADAAGSTVTYLFDEVHRSYLYGGEVTGPDRRRLLGN